MIERRAVTLHQAEIASAPLAWRAGALCASVPACRQPTSGRAVPRYMSRSRALAWRADLVIVLTNAASTAWLRCLGRKRPSGRSMGVLHVVRGLAEIVEATPRSICAFRAIHARHLIYGPKESGRMQLGARAGVGRMQTVAHCGVVVSQRARACTCAHIRLRSDSQWARATP